MIQIETLKRNSQESLFDLPVWEYKEMGPDGVISSSYINIWYKRTEKTVTEEIIKQLADTRQSYLSFRISQDDVRKLVKTDNNYDYWKEDELLIKLFKPLGKILHMKKISVVGESFICFTHLWQVYIVLERK